MPSASLPHAQSSPFETPLSAPATPGPTSSSATNSSIPLTSEQKTRIRYLRDHAQKVESVRNQQTIIANHIKSLYGIEVPISQVKPWGLRAYGIELKCNTPRAQPFLHHWKKWSRKAPLEEMLKDGEIAPILLPGVVCPERPGERAVNLGVTAGVPDAVRKYQEFVEKCDVEVAPLTPKVREPAKKKRKIEERKEAREAECVGEGMVSREQETERRGHTELEVLSDHSGQDGENDEELAHRNNDQEREEEEDDEEDFDVDDDPIQRLSQYFATRAAAEISRPRSDNVNPTISAPEDRISALERENAGLKQRLSEIQLKDEAIASLRSENERLIQSHKQEVLEKDSKIAELQLELVTVRAQMMQLLSMRTEYTKEVERQIQIRWGKEQGQRARMLDVQMMDREESSSREMAGVRAAESDNRGHIANKEGVLAISGSYGEEAGSNKEARDLGKTVHDVVLHAGGSAGDGSLRRSSRNK